MKDKNPSTEVVAASQPVSSPVMELSAVNIGNLFSEAVKQGSAMEVIKELRLMEADIQERRAKAAFDDALSAFQAECPIITKDKGVPDRTGATAYKYAQLESIEVQVRPILRKHGFSHTFDTDTLSAPGWVVAKCIVTHRAGHSRISTAKFPLGTKTLLMSETQVYAAALTFANRRALQNAYGLIIAGEDLDGATGKLKQQSPNAFKGQDVSEEATKPKTELWTLMGEELRGTARNWDMANQWLWKHELLDGAIPEALPDISKERLKEVIAKVKAKLNKQ